MCCQIARVTFYIPLNGEILLVLGKNRRKGHFNNFGGWMEKGETCLQAAQRETREETQLDLGKDRFRSYGSFTLARNGQNFTWQSYAVELTFTEYLYLIRSFVPNNEISEIRVVQIRELIKKKEDFYDVFLSEVPRFLRLLIQ